MKTLAVKSQAISDILATVVFVASSTGVKSSIFAFTFLSVSFKFSIRSLISTRASSPSLAVFRSWTMRATRKATDTTMQIVITRNKNWFKVNDIGSY